MTKQDPSKLCKACKAFDQMMNDQGEGDIRLSLDVYVQCEHEEDVTDPERPFLATWISKEEAKKLWPDKPDPCPCSQWISDPFTDKIRCPECGQTGEEIKNKIETENERLP
jgi:hypothetical protein